LPLRLLARGALLAAQEFLPPVSGEHRAGDGFLAVPTMTSLASDAG
jgi:hypothetical protein